MKNISNIVTLGPEPFLELSRKLQIIDVRAPREFKRGHIPGAINIPIFNDIERGKVGVTYHQSGREAAVMKGLEIVGPKMVDFVKKARVQAREKEILVHCWRGGMRSESMAWLFATSGLKPYVLDGGYKSYRAFIRNKFGEGPEIFVLGGKTGSGKTEVLKELDRRGEQVIDLEGMANHKGSAYGSIGEPDQPTNEQFENNLAEVWIKLDESKHVWLEDESLQIGRVSVPKPLYDRMRDAQVIFIELSKEQRIRNLVSLYVQEHSGELIEMTKRISRRLGGLDTDRAVRAIESGDYEEAADLTLNYYDKAYMRGLLKREAAKIIYRTPMTADPKEIAGELMDAISAGSLIRE